MAQEALGTIYSSLIPSLGLPTIQFMIACWKLHLHRLYVETLACLLTAGDCTITRNSTTLKNAFIKWSYGKGIFRSILIFAVALHVVISFRKALEKQFC